MLQYLILETGFISRAANYWMTSRSSTRAVTVLTPPSLEPDATDCPSTEVCEHVVYTFQSQKLDGFSVEYPSAVWRQMLTASTKEFGHSKHKSAHIGSMGVETSKWKLADGNSLTFVHYSGSDLNGSAIARPFSVQYGSDAE